MYTTTSTTSNSIESVQYPVLQSQQYNDGDSLLEQPTLPWMKSENNTSNTSLHTMKRTTDDDEGKKKRRRWSKHKWWLFLSNTLVK